MDVGKAFTYISEDENWVRKLGLGALVGMIPILNFAAIGYQVQISRNVAAGEKRPLPEWDNIGDLFLDGLRVFGALVVYMLPFFLLFGVTMASGFFSVAFFEPTAASSTPDIPPGFIIAMSIMFLCGMPYTLFITLLRPLIYIQAARTHSFSACFDFREMWQLVRQNTVNYLLVVGLYLGLAMGMSFFIMPAAFVLMLIPCLGMLALMAIQGAVMILLQVVSGHLQGQFIQLNSIDSAVAPDKPLLIS